MRAVGSPTPTRHFLAVDSQRGLVDPEIFFWRGFLLEIDVVKELINSFACDDAIAEYLVKISIVRGIDC